MIKNISGDSVPVIALRRNSAADDISVKPVNTFPIVLDDVVRLFQIQLSGKDLLHLLHD